MLFFMHLYQCFGEIGHHNWDREKENNKVIWFTFIDRTVRVKRIKRIYLINNLTINHHIWHKLTLTVLKYKVNDLIKSYKQISNRKIYHKVHNAVFNISQIYLCFKFYTF